MNSSSGSSGTASSKPSLRKPASTTLLSMHSSPTTSSTTPTSGWKSIFRIPSSKKLNAVPPPLDTVPNDDHASSQEHGSYHSSRSSGSDHQSRSPVVPHHSASSYRNGNGGALVGSPSSYKPANPLPASTNTSSASPVQVPRRQRSGFLSRKLSSAKPQGPQTAQPSQQSFQQSALSPSHQLGNGIAGGPIPASPKSSIGSAARFLRRVASAPNAKGLLNPRNPASTTKNGMLAPSLEVPPPMPAASSDKGVSIETNSSQSSARGSRTNRSLTASSVQKIDPPPRQAFRRTYSSNSMKHRAVEVRPSSFQKIKMLGRGDVGKVYLVREKKTDKLFAMKGLSHLYRSIPF